MNVSDYLTKLQNVKESGPNSWKASCPAHEDNKPSLSIKVGDTGKILFKCFAGCSYDQIMHALDIPQNGHNGHNGSYTQPVPIKQRRERRRVVARYDYTDENGTLLFQKLRYQPKSFAVRRPNGTWGIGDTRRVLYHLPDLYKTTAMDIVYIVEGEKDVDRLVSLGLIATCNFDGAGPGKWHDDYNPYFDKLIVYILPDNDSPGRTHADAIAKGVYPYAQAVKIVSLPELPEHGDISDWLDNGHDVAELEKLCLLSPKWKPNQDEPEQIINTSYPKTKDYLTAFNILRLEFRLNDLDNSIEVNEKTIDDTIEADILNRCRDLGLNATAWVQRAWMSAANENRYHPIKEWMNSLEWDGVNHIGALVHGYLNETTGLGEAAFTRWLIGAVAKVFENAQNFMLVWDGKQGIGKSTLARWIGTAAGESYFIEGGINTDDKDSMLRACTHLIWEVGELQATTRKADREALKDFISKKVITVRRSYGHYDMVKPALASLIGTINEDGAGFLTDPTGSRRYVIINLGNINYNYAQDINPSNLWAQAVALYRRGEPWLLTPEEQAMQAQINARYEMDSMVAVIFNDLFTVDPSSSDFVTMVDIMQALDDAGLKGSQQQNMREVARLLKKLGAKQFRARVGTKRPQAYMGVKRIETVKIQL